MTEPTDAELQALWVACDHPLPQNYARAVLAKWGQPAQAAEPFGYVNTYTGQFYKDVEPCRKNNEGHWRTVFTSQQPTQTQPVAREPLTPEQIATAGEIEDNDSAFLAGFSTGARFAEQHHGIKGGQHGDAKP